MMHRKPGPGPAHGRPGARASVSMENRSPSHQGMSPSAPTLVRRPGDSESLRDYHTVVGAGRRPDGSFGGAPGSFGGAPGSFGGARRVRSGNAPRSDQGRAGFVRGRASGSFGERAGFALKIRIATSPNGPKTPSLGSVGATGGPGGMPTSSWACSGPSRHTPRHPS